MHAYALTALNVMLGSPASIFWRAAYPHYNDDNDNNNKKKNYQSMSGKYFFNFKVKSNIYISELNKYRHVEFVSFACRSC